MKLTIITPCSRPHNLWEMSKSIPLDVRWIVVFDSYVLPMDVLKLPKNAECYCFKGGLYGYPQTNYGLTLVEDGYVYFLDDDTLLHKNLIPILTKVLLYQDADFIHFNQQGPLGQPRLGGQVEIGAIDKGSFVVARKLIGDLQFMNHHSADGVFAKEVLGRAKNSLYVNEVLSTYNALRTNHSDIPADKIGQTYPIRYSVIIPTMWKDVESLKFMIDKYHESPYVGEILIINNYAPGEVDLGSYKVRFIGTGVNMFVNPAWNLGVAEAACEKIIIANDDIRISQFDEVMQAIDARLQKGDIIGPNAHCFEQHGLEISKITFRNEIKDQGFGYGCFMVLHKSDYTTIPNELQVWCGDNIQSSMLNNISFHGVAVKTPMQTTSKTLDLSTNRKNEFPFFKRWWDERFGTPKTIVLVLRSGGDFVIDDVLLLVHHLRKNMIPETRIICLHDKVEKIFKMDGFELHPMPYKEWSGWWSKMNLFSPALAHLRPFLYMDLDTAVVSNMDGFKIPLKLTDSFIGVDDFYRIGKLQSCMLYFPKMSAKINKVWDRWIASPSKWVAAYRGDQDFIESTVVVDAYFQTFSSSIKTFKPRNDGYLTNLSKGLVVVCFHGQPRILQAAKSVDWVANYVHDAFGKGYYEN